jgi:subtilisin family serine protease
MPSFLKDLDPEAEVIQHYSIPAPAGWNPAHISARNYPQAFKGYSIKGNDKVKEALEHDPRVDYVEQNKRVFLDIQEEKPGNESFPRYNPKISNRGTIKGSGIWKTMASQPNAPWNLVRLSQRELPLGTSYNYGTRSGGDIDAYVVDTGVFVEHSEFAPARARWGATFIPNEPMQDLNGHGSHVAGLIGGNTWGTAKAVNLIAVKVLDAKGSGDWSGIIAGINWVAENVQKSGRVSVLKYVFLSFMDC